LKTVRVQLVAAVLLGAGTVASGQPVPLGQSARTQTGWTGLTVPGVSPARVTTAASVSGPASATPEAHGFSTTILGQPTTLSMVASAISEPAITGLPPVGEGFTLSAGSSINLTNSRVAGSTFSSSATASFSETFNVNGLTSTPAFIDLVFRVQGTMLRSAGINNIISRVVVSAGTPDGAGEPIYIDTLGQSPILRGVALAPANPLESIRVVDQTIVQRLVLPAGGTGSASVALSLNAFTSVGTSTLVGLNAIASSQFTGGLVLTGISVRDADGVQITPGQFDFTSESGTEYSLLLLPSPGAMVLLAMGGLVSTRRRRAN